MLLLYLIDLVVVLSVQKILLMLCVPLDIKQHHRKLEQMIREVDQDGLFK